MTMEDWYLIINSHLNGTFNCIRHTASLMKEQGWGRIINTTSGAWLGSKSYCNYSAAKAGIIGLTRGVAGDMYKHGVTCNVFSPTAMTRSLFNLVVRARVMAEAGTPIISKEQLEQIEATPGPESVAPFVVYLASDNAAYISGTVFRLRGSNIGIYPEPEVEKTIDKDGIWEIAELTKLVPTTLLERYKSPVSN
jgi:NAD(P)-dependent dehydrogenase (short-subunit alcohol dehydrogenase family)